MVRTPISRWPGAEGDGDVIGLLEFLILESVSFPSGLYAPNSVALGKWMNIFTLSYNPLSLLNMV